MRHTPIGITIEKLFCPGKRFVKGDFILNVGADALGGPFEFARTVDIPSFYRRDAEGGVPYSVHSASHKKSQERTYAAARW